MRAAGGRRHAFDVFSGALVIAAESRAPSQLAEKLVIRIRARLQASRKRGFLNSAFRRCGDNINFSADCPCAASAFLKRAFSPGASMTQISKWFERKFEFSFPAELFPNFCIR